MSSTVHIIKDIPACRLRERNIAPDFEIFETYRPLYPGKESLVRFAKEKGQVTGAFQEDGTLPGYLLLSGSGLSGTVRRDCRQVLIEFTAIEVFRPFRNAGIANPLMTAVFGQGEYPGNIVCLKGYSWTWDLDHSRLTATGYSDMLISLYKRYGFTRYQTNDPNVCLNQENFLMARVGKWVPKALVEQFRWFCYGITPEMTATPLRSALNKIFARPQSVMLIFLFFCIC